ncbi:MAG: cytochrome b [Proteobacteria bacterium]|nr:cytochrome b [Pseudomonadota bacterium]
MTPDAPNPLRTYSRTAKALHWLVALLIVAQLVIGWTMPHVRKGTLPIGEIGWHVIVGVLIILLVAVRIVVRIARPPTGGSAAAGLVDRLGQGVHALLYLLMVVVPILGWANANSRDWAVGLAPLFELPRIMPVGSKLGHDLGDIHSDLALVMAVIIGLHVLAGLYHHWIRRDDTLRRMM